MGLNTILAAGMSGLQTAQTQLRVVSDNVANVNTPGYIRKLVEQVPTSSNGIGTGVDVGSITLAADKYLQQASLNANTALGAANIGSQLYDRVQQLFGDPSSDTGFFADVNQLYTSFASAAENASSQPLRQQVVTDAKQVFDDAGQMAQGIQDVRSDADSRITSDIDQVNGLLQQVEDLNVQISRTTVAGGDASGAITQQDLLIDQVSKFLDVRVGTRTTGGVTLRTTDGVLLAGDGIAQLSYDRAGVATAQTQFNDIWITPPSGQKLALADHISSGEIKGLVDLRDKAAPQAAARLSELTSQIADQLNAAHNANAGLPPPTTLAGKSTGLDLTSAIGGFTGTTNVAIVNSSGVVQTQVAIDFTAGTMSVNGGAPSGFSPGTFLASLNASLGGSGSASFSASGALSISASGGNGVAIADDATTPSSNAGRGFSWYFGLNDLVTSSQLTNYQTGLKGTDPNGFTPGQTITLRLTSSTGSRMTDISVAVPPAGSPSMDDMLAALNDPTTGVGRYGTFALDAKGQLAFTAGLSPAPTLSVVSDNTTRGLNGPSMTQMFGIGAGIRDSRTSTFSIRTDIDQDPSKLSLGQLDLSVTAGTPAVVAGDGRGARRLADAGQSVANFQSAGGAPGGAMTVSRYMSDVAGDIGGRAAEADSKAKGAQALSDAATSSRTAQEGVNLDEELVKLTTYQQGYNASARLIQAAKDMYDTLLGMMN
jgi:flagellar hook-associated protein 1 FlgK